jgi:hypothetical protein
MTRGGVFGVEYSARLVQYGYYYHGTRLQSDSARATPLPSSLFPYAATFSACTVGGAVALTNNTQEFVNAETTLTTTRTGS